MGKKTWTDQQLTDAVSNSFSYRQVLFKLRLAEAGGNYKTIQSRIRELGLDVSHFTLQGWRKGSKYPVTKAKTLSDVLVQGSSISSYKLKQRLIREGIFAEECQKCKRTKWMGLIIPLELDHINGISDDNRLENLRILCPNCHAQTPTYRGRNIGILSR